MKKRELIKKKINKGLVFGIAAAVAAAMISPVNFGQAGLSEVYAAEDDNGISTMPLPIETPAYVRSVYTNEWITPEQAAVRPIAVMMPTDKTAQLIWHKPCQGFV